MTMKNLLIGASVASLVTCLSASAIGQEVVDQEVVDQIVVTGSLIRGTPTNSALPVEVLTAEELSARGRPSAVEFVKTLSIAHGIIGDANQFSSGKGQRAEGMGSVNLRGLGPERTLVLLNGKRLPLADGKIVDALKIPYSAIGRIEILKDGASATYGSDAVSGVVNFITRQDLQGFEVGGDYRVIDGSDGDYTANAAWGWSDDRTRLLVSADYQHRSPLNLAERDFAIRPFSTNPEGNWSGSGHPNRYFPVDGSFNGLTTAPVTDVLCGSLGTVLTNPNGGANASGFNSCRAQSAGFSNLVEKQDSFQIYAEFESEIADGIEFTLEGLYSRADLETISSPSFPILRAATETVLPAGHSRISGGTDPATSIWYFVPDENPGFISYTAANPTAFPVGTEGVFIPIASYRPFGIGGNPLFGGNGASRQERDQEQIRISAGLAGEFSDNVRWQTNVTYGEYYFRRTGNDSLTGRVALAFQGLGGPNCDFETGTPGVGGCMWLNPFSNSIQSNAVTGELNTGYDASVANGVEIADWIFPGFQFETTSRQLEYNALLDGTIEGFSLPGGKIGWAVGAQYRRVSFKSEPSELVNNLITPCADSPINGDNDCTPTLQSPFGLGGTEAPFEATQNIYAFFGEAEFPLTDTLNVNVGLRFEDYGQFGGTTLNPQVRAKWQALDFLAFRGSAGTTFRAPSQTLLEPNPAVSTRNILGAVLPVEVRGNPNLEPEEAFTFNLGMLIDTGNFNASIDYFNISLEKAITSEPLTPVIEALFPNNGTPASGNCATLDPQFIADHFDFSGACSALNVTRVRTLNINGPDIDTSGLDFVADYLFEDVGGGELEIGGNLSYLLNYKIGDLLVGDVRASAGGDVSGFLNDGNTLAHPLPKFKGYAYANYNMGAHNFRWSTKYAHSYEDNRSIFGPNPSYCTDASNPAGCGTVAAGQEIDSIFTHDFTYQFFLSDSVTLMATVTNIFDKEPPFARTQISYDALTHDPLLRTFKFGVQARF